MLVVILGVPTPATAVAVLRDGWMLSIIAFVAVAVASLPLGRLQSSTESEGVDDGSPALVQAPAPRETEGVERGSAVAGPTDLSGVAMLRDLPPEARRGLEEAARLRTVRAGSWLIRQGDPPGAAYVVRRGRLEVEVGGTFVRELGPGDVLGELALLTGEQRSAGVRARRDSTVLEVPREAFVAMLENDSSAARTVLTQVAERLRTVGQGTPAHRRDAQPGVVAVVGLHPGSGCAEVADVLGRRISQHVSVVFPGVVGPDALEVAEAEHDRVILVADGVGDRCREGLERLLPATGRPGRAGRPQRLCGAHRCAGAGAVPPARPRAGRPRSRHGAARGVGGCHRCLAADLRRS